MSAEMDVTADDLVECFSSIQDLHGGDVLHAEAEARHTLERIREEGREEVRALVRARIENDARCTWSEDYGLLNVINVARLEVALESKS